MTFSPRFAALHVVFGLALAGATLGACGSHPYRVEEREVPVHVWLTAPQLAEQGGTVQALVYVGPMKVVEGPVRFEPGKPTVALPTAYVRAGTLSVSAVLEGGALSATQQLDVTQESWVQITLRGRTLTLGSSETQPSPLGR